MITTFGAVGSIAYSASATADPFSVVANSGLNVRSGPGLNHRVLGVLPTNARIDSTGPARDGWMPITYQGGQGWVSDAYLNAIGAGNTPSAAIPATRGTAYTTAPLNVRTGAGLTFRVETVLDLGTKVETTGVEADSYAQIVHGGALRWVSKTYLSQTAPETPKPAAPGLPAVKSTATATSELLVRSSAGDDFEVIATVPAGSKLSLTGVTQSGRTQVVHEGQVAWVNSLYLSGSSNVPKPPTAALPRTIGKTYATADLLLRDSPEAQFVSYGTAPTGSTIEVTGRNINGMAEIVHKGTVRWVTARYLSATAPDTTKAPAATPVKNSSSAAANLSGTTTTTKSSDTSKSSASTGSSSNTSSRFNLPNLTASSRTLLGKLESRFPEVRTIYGVRQDPLPDHPSGRALDIMVYSNEALGDRVAEWTRENAQELNIDYIIWNQRIWSVARASEGWRHMADRGSVTANHRDHVHITVKR